MPTVVPIGYPAGFVPQIVQQPAIIPGIEQSPHWQPPNLLEPSGWGTPDSSRSDGSMSPVRQAETAQEEYSPSRVSFITIMHTLAVITAIIFALAAFCRTQPIQARCRGEQGNTVQLVLLLILQCQMTLPELWSHRCPSQDLCILTELPRVSMGLSLL